MSRFLVKSFFWLTASEIIYNLTAYVIHGGMGRILGPAEYGRYAIVITLTTMIVVLIGRSVPTAMSKYLSEISKTSAGLIPIIKKQTAVIQTILIGGVTLIFFLLAPVISRLLGDLTLVPLFRLSTLIIPAFALSSFYFYYFTGLHRFNTQAFLKTIRSAARLVFILGLAWYFKSRGFALEGAILGYVLAPLSVFFAAILLDPHRKRKSEGQFDWRQLIYYAWPVTLFLIAYEFLITIDLYLVKGILRDDYLTGIYNAAITVGRIPYYLFYALTIILLPTVSKTTSSNDHNETEKIISQSLRLMIMFLMPTCILMSFFSEPIIKIFFTSKFVDAALPMSIFVFGIGFLTVFYVLTFILNGAGKVKVPMIISFFGLAINVILTYFLIKKYALLGAVIGTSITSFVIMVIILVYAYRHFGYLFKLKSFIKIILASLGMLAAAFLLPRENYTFIIWSVILIGFYLLILFLLREFGPSELALIKQLSSRKKK